MIATEWPFIELDDLGHPMIRGTRHKVLLLVQEHLEYGWDAEQIQRQHPNLMLPQVYAALGYYYEHQTECARMLDERNRLTEDLRKELENPDLQDRLRSLRDGA